MSFELPELELEVGCSAGTYVRSLARDLGEELGCHGYLAGLVRTRVGAFTLEESCSLERLESLGSEERWRAHVLPVERALSVLPAVVLSDEAVKSIWFGRSVETGDGRVEAGEGQFPPASCEVRMHDRQGRFLGVGRLDPGDNGAAGLLQPRRLLAEAFAGE